MRSKYLAFTLAALLFLVGGVVSHVVIDSIGLPATLFAQGGGTSLGAWTFDQRFRYNRVTTDFTTASASLVTITGLSWSLPGGAALNVPFVCELAVSQATAAVANAFGLQIATTSPTNVEAMGVVGTSATAIATGAVAITNTTATNIVAFTPSAITTVWPAHLAGMIENASNTGDNTINVMVLTGNASDSVTVKRGSFCRSL
jgi:hypothetical protein